MCQQPSPKNRPGALGSPSGPLARTKRIRSLGASDFGRSQATLYTLNVKTKIPSRDSTPSPVPALSLGGLTDARRRTVCHTVLRLLDHVSVALSDLDSRTMF